MTDSKSNIEFIANKLGIDKQFIKSNVTTGEIFYKISGNIDKKLEIPKQLITELPQNFHLEFRHCIFKQEISINNCNISKNISFWNCIFKERVSFIGVTFEQEINFNGNTFQKKVVFIKTTFQKETSFIIVAFQKEVVFIGVKFKDKANFMLNIFKEKINFSRTIFGENVYFNNSHFCEYADFHECDFEKFACFYGVDFKKTPNFSQTVFKGNLNLINAKLNFDFEDLKEKIKEEYENNKEKPLENITNDFRDSFRIFKNALIKDNNLLDASNFHRIELYCKEIELRESLNKKGIEAKSENDIRKNTNRVRDVVDSLLLGFYRKLSDHHTDFLRVLNNLIMLIALYTAFSMELFQIHKDVLKNDENNIVLFSLFHTYEYWIISGIYSSLVFGIVILYKQKLCIKFWKKFYKIFLKLSKKSKKIVGGILIIKDFYDFIESIIIALCFSSLFYILFRLLVAILHLKEEIVYSAFVNALFLSLYLCLICTKSLFFGRYMLLIISYVWFIFIIVCYPSMIYPSIFNISADKTSGYLPLITLNIIYALLLGLVLFSLQKTARKNSIVPS